MVTFWAFGEQVIISLVGSLLLGAIIFIAVMLFLALWRNLDFRFAFMLFTPGIMRIAQAGWFPTWVEPMLWIFTVGIGLYMIWSRFANG